VSPFGDTPGASDHRDRTQGAKRVDTPRPFARQYATTIRLMRRRELLAALPLIPAMRTLARRAALLPFIELDHLSIRVSDVRRSARFYMQLFGSDASRDPNRQANPGSQAGELWFIRLGRSHLALAPTSPTEPPGVDHYCLSVSAFSKETAKATLASFEQPFPQWPSNNVWLRDPDGVLLQLAPSANEPQLATIVRNAVAVPRGGDSTVAPFRATRISRLVLTAARLADSESYYSRLLGDAKGSGASRSFEVGPSSVTVASGESPSFRIALAAFDRASAHNALSSLGITPQAAADRSVIAVHDPDGLPFELGAAD
jgi:catechol 2,3-dioxygenase-like lactoylglutathione lyase family enzyme